ncbi:MAG: diguanylate cyclase [Actinobacteria bacterium]|nr:diguanylate cyclase [Actinomycetota bacterium]
MNKKIKLLILEKSEKEVEPILKELKSYGYSPEYKLLCTSEEFSESIKKGSWDAVIASKELKSLKAADALQFLKGKNLDIPFIIVSGRSNEESLIPLIKSGANDYVRKDDMFMLPQVLNNEIENAKLRKKHKKALGKLKESERRFRILAESASDIIYIYKFSPKKGYEFVSPSVESKLGYPVSDFYNDPKFGCKIIYEDDLKIINQIETGKFEFGSPVEFRCIDTEGHIIWFEEVVTPFYNKRGDLMAIEGIMRDITGRKEAEEQLEYLSFHDSLTNLYNRAYFEEELKRLDTKRQLPLSVIIADVNGLKLINDAFGHKEGDRLLRSCGGVLKKCCRSEDMVARWGGDEFSMLLPKTNEEDATVVLNRISKTCHRTSGNKIPLSMSLGTATKISRDEDFQSTIKKAEDSMYHHKLMETKSIISSIINSLEQTLFEKSIRTEKHSRYLKELTMKIGKAINLPEEKIDDLRVLTTLHDIGKIAILDNILNKKETLTKREWEIIKRHPEIGYRIAMSSNQLSSIAEYILNIHEHWDGNGYPQGIKGEKIPLLSRIIALVDSYVVMRENRPYRKARSRKEAIEEIKRCRGTQFDPKLVDIFLKITERKLQPAR